MSTGPALLSKLGRITKVAFSKDGKSVFFEAKTYLSDPR